jgi:hypothetical protein
VVVAQGEVAEFHDDVLTSTVGRCGTRTEYGSCLRNLVNVISAHHPPAHTASRTTGAQRAARPAADTWESRSGHATASRLALTGGRSLPMECR